ncbi:MAG: sulfotransferase [Cyclobacteriaceae bacterium]
MSQNPLVSSDTKAWFPNLFIPGAMKAGTTTLHYCLSQHPSIYMAQDKEPNFFTNDRTFGLLDEYYQPLFRDGINYCYRGEASINYMGSLKAIQRIREWTISPRFIFILRNPVDRAISHYNFYQGRGFEHKSFRDAFYDSISVPYDEDHISPAYYARGHYARWIETYQQTFGKEFIHLITTEALQKQPQQTINSCFSFLDLPLLPTIEVPLLNQSTVLKNPRMYKQAMDLMSGRHNSLLKRWYQKVFSDRHRITIRRKALQIVEATKTKFLSFQQPDSIDEDTRQWVASYYHEDVKQLKKLTECQFSNWMDFN